MRYADTSAGSYENDDSLEAIENNDEGFGIPGQSAVGTVGGFRFADIGNEDENSTRLTALGDQPMDTIDVTGKPPVVRSETEAVTPGELSPIIGANMSMNARIAYVMENGEPRCNHCETNYFPGTRLACTNCGCGRPNDDHGAQSGNFKGQDLTHVEGPTVADEAGSKDIIKEESKLSFVDMAMDAFSKQSNASNLYNQGYLDAQSGKELDDDLALLSKDYYEGYTQYKFYNKTPQQSEGQSLFDIKPNSNQIPRSHNEMRPEEYDRGPLELTDGTGHVTASRKVSSLFPIDVIQKFFEI